jgi:hypothetical protein
MLRLIGNLICGFNEDQSAAVTLIPDPFGGVSESLCRDNLLEKCSRKAARDTNPQEKSHARCAGPAILGSPTSDRDPYNTRSLYQSSSEPENDDPYGKESPPRITASGNSILQGLRGVRSAEGWPARQPRSAQQGSEALPKGS